MPDFYDVQPFLYGQGRYLLFILKGKQVSYVVLYPKRKRLIGVHFGDGLLLTASVVEDAYKHLNGTTRPFYKTVADIKHYLPDTKTKTDPIT